MILCGHSRGGIVISSVAERTLGRSVSSLVYITALMLPHGQSLRGFQMEAQNPQFSTALRRTADGSAVRFEPTAAAELLYHRCCTKPSSAMPRDGSSGVRTAPW